MTTEETWNESILGLNRLVIAAKVACHICGSFAKFPALKELCGDSMVGPPRDDHDCVIRAHFLSVPLCRARQEAA